MRDCLNESEDTLVAGIAIGIDSAGDMRWQHVYGEPGDEWATGVLLETDGEIVFLGAKELGRLPEDWDKDLWDLWLVKTRVDGTVDATCPGDLGRAGSSVLSDGDAAVVQTSVAARDTNVAVVDTDAVASDPFFGFHSTTQCSASF